MSYRTSSLKRARTSSLGRRYKRAGGSTTSLELIGKMAGKTDTSLVRNMVATRSLGRSPSIGRTPSFGRSSSIGRSSSFGRSSSIGRSSTPGWVDTSLPVMSLGSSSMGLTQCPPGKIPVGSKCVNPSGKTIQGALLHHAIARDNAKLSHKKHSKKHSKKHY